jgi:hypothetical protein
MAVDPLESITGALLLFVLPGLAWTLALFPEWRFRGPLAITRAVETATAAFVMSLAFTVLVGFALTFNVSGPFPATWSDPVLEEILAAIAAIGFILAYFRGAFDRVPPAAPAPEPAPGADAPTPVLEELSELRTIERRLRHRLRQRGLGSSERERVEAELGDVERKVEALRRRREDEYAA